MKVLPYYPVFLVGPTYTGKSTFLNNNDALQKGEGFPKRGGALVATMGVDMRLWETEKKPIRVFDTGGIKRFYQILTYYLSGRPSVCVFFSEYPADGPMDKKLEEFRQWREGTGVHKDSLLLYVELPPKDKKEERGLRLINEELKAEANFHPYKAQVDVREQVGVILLDALLRDACVSYYEEMQLRAKASPVKPVIERWAVEADSDADSVAIDPVAEVEMTNLLVKSPELPKPTPAVRKDDVAEESPGVVSSMLYSLGHRFFHRNAKTPVSKLAADAKHVAVEMRPKLMGA